MFSKAPRVARGQTTPDLEGGDWGWAGLYFLFLARVQDFAVLKSGGVTLRARTIYLLALDSWIIGGIDWCFEEKPPTSTSMCKATNPGKCRSILGWLQ